MVKNKVKDIYIPENFSESDLGAAERMKLLLDAGVFRQPVMYVEDSMNPKTGEWLVYDGSVWKPASSGYLKRLVDLTVYQVKKSAEDAFRLECAAIKKTTTDKAKMKAAMAEAAQKTLDFAKKFAKNYNSEHGVVNALKAFRRLAPNVKGTNIFDADNWKLNLKNGYLDLRTGVLEPHKPEHYCRKIFNASYGTVDCNFYSNEFLPLINSYFPGIETTCIYFAKVLGYCLTGDTGEQKLFFLLGSGKNGKSALSNLVLGTWGDYGGVVPTGALLSSKGDGNGEAPSPQIDRLEGMRMVLAHEIPTAMRKINEEKVKTLTGDAVITTRTLNKGGHSWLPRMKILMDLNDMPEVSDPTSISLRRRLRAIPFNAFFQKGDKSYMHMENDERFRDALLRFAYEGLRLVLADGTIDHWTGDWNDKQGLPIPVLDALRDYYDKSDSLTQFFEEILIVTGNSNNFMTVSRMYESFRTEYGTTMTLKSFAQKLKGLLTKKGCTYAVRFDGKYRGRGYTGIRFRCDADENDNNNGQRDNLINSTGKGAPTTEANMFENQEIVTD